MSDACEVAIIGAGVVGCSIAFHLARLGQKDVRILEREALPGSGSTAKANGGIRAQFTTDVNVRMSLASMDILDALEPEIGEPPVYRKAGYLFVTGSAERLEAMRAAAAYQRARGVAVEVLEEKGVRDLAPWVGGAIVGGTFGARDGFIDPGRLANFFLGDATTRGVSIQYQAELTSAERERGGYRLRTSAGELFAGRVVNAAGAYAAGVAELFAVKLPVVPVRRHLFLTGPCPQIPARIPMTIDADSGVLVRREGDRVLIAYSNPDEPAGFNTSFDAQFPERFIEPLTERFPLVAEAGLDMRRSWAGLYEVTPDHHAVIDEPLPGFFLANGFSGHGVMHSPAAGRCVAEMIVQGRSSMDVAALSLSRFATGKLIHETMVL
jgi:sarcosine oxidase subunit beta